MLSPLWSSGQGSWLQIQRSRVRFLQNNDITFLNITRRHYPQHQNLYIYDSENLTNVF
jgi:hypothetical protein